MNVTDVIRSPLTWLSSVLGVVLYDPSILSALAGATWANLGQLFTLASLAGLTLPKYWPPESSAEWAVVIIGLAFALKIGHGVLETYENNL